MDTFGSVIDKITILEKRMSKTENEDSLYELRKQMSLLFKELISISSKNIDGSRPTMFKKHKQYDSDVSIDGETSLIDLIYDLKNINSNLWEIEDKRRDTSLEDSERLSFADQVSIYNKKRNDSIDRIDEILHGIISDE